MAAFSSPDLSSPVGSPVPSVTSTVFSNSSHLTMFTVSTATSQFSSEQLPPPSSSIKEIAWQHAVPDYEWAERLMLEHCSDSDSTRKSGVFTYKEATAALSKIADGAVPNATPELVQALLENDADVCLERRKSSNLFKKMKGKNQEDIRGNLLERATLNCSSSILYCLIMEADEPSLDRALPIAMSQNDEEKVTMLRIKGADAGPLCEQFLRAVDSGVNGVVKSLVTGFKGACQKCRDNGLVRAAKLGFGSMVQVLLNNGADVNFGSGAALMAAVEDGWDAIATTIISHLAKPSCNDLLDKAVLQSYNYGRLSVLEACLKAGAQGPATATTLIHTIRREQHELAETLVRYGASVEYREAESLKFAIGTGKPDLLRILLSGKPSQSSIAAAFTEATKISDIRVAHQTVEILILSGLRGDHVNDMLVRSLDSVSMAGDDQSRYELVDLLLTKGSADINSHDGRPLALAAAKGWVKILELLIHHRPQVQSLRDALKPAMRLDDPGLRKHIIESILAGAKGNTLAIEKLKATGLALAARSRHLDVLDFLAQSELSTLSINTGFAEAISGGEHLFKSEEGLNIIQFFLKHEASGPLIGEAFCQAVKLFERDAIEMLSTAVDITAVNKSLRGLIEYSDDWHAPDDRNIWVVEQLLEMGADGETLSLALVRAIQAYVSGRGSETLVDTLLESEKADVNYSKAEALKVAVRAGNATLLQKLATNGATRETLTHAFAEAVAVQLEENTVLSLIDALILPKNANCLPDFCTVLPGRSPPIIECLTAHPESVKLVARLAQLGCDLEAKCDTVLLKHAEPVAALMWSLKAGSSVSRLVIEALVDAKANVQVAAPLSGVTPLIMAAINGRADVVQKLIKANADTLARDHRDRTALYYAAQAGNLDVVKPLLKAKFRLNDGSLHEAARELHCDVVAALIKAGYSTGFPSSRPEHNGRTPIQELACKSDGTRSTLEIESTLIALKEGKLALLDKWQGKNPLFLALENSYAVTLALLDIVMWPVINDEGNVFVDLDYDGKRLFFSPTMYMRFYWSQTSGYQQLERLLRTKHCVDRYYAELGAEQPVGAVGLPDDIAKEDRRIRAEAEKRQKREQEHQDKLRWESEEAALKRGNIAMLHHAQLDQQVEKMAVTEQSKTRAALITQSEIQRKQQLELSFQQQIGQQKIEQQRKQNMLAAEAQRQKMLQQARRG
ncbi:hypothetical protein F4818DRAFT_395403 [Hypoxylon cercidicola]|nr:hypothetical protein F4818DRAFT_395403 [Hypoxylon cercidicola]